MQTPTHGRKEEGARLANQWGGCQGGATARNGSGSSLGPACSEREGLGEHGSARGPKSGLTGMGEGGHFDDRELVRTPMDVE